MWLTSMPCRSPQHTSVKWHFANNPRCGELSTMMSSAHRSALVLRCRIRVIFCSQYAVLLTFHFYGIVDYLAYCPRFLYGLHACISRALASWLYGALSSICRYVRQSLDRCCLLLYKPRPPAKRGMRASQHPSMSSSALCVLRVTVHTAVAFHKWYHISKQTHVLVTCYCFRAYTCSIFPVSCKVPVCVYSLAAIK